MANPRLPSDFWDGEEEQIHYPNATPRRVALAHALGVVGVLGTLTLAGFAFAPRMPAITSRFQGLFAKEASAQNPAKPVAQVPAAQVQAPVPPPPVPSVEVAPVAPAVIPSAQPSSASDAATAPEATTAPEVVAPPPAPPSPPAASEPAASEPAATEPAATEPAATEPAATSTPAPVARSRPRAEPPLTTREIERREQRYQMWLKREGLEPVH